MPLGLWSLGKGASGMSELYVRKGGRHLRSRVLERGRGAGMGGGRKEVYIGRTPLYGGFDMHGSHCNWQRNRAKWHFWKKSQEDRLKTQGGPPFER